MDWKVYLDKLNDYSVSQIRDFFETEGGMIFRKIMEDGMETHIKDAWQAGIDNKSESAAQYNSAAHAIRFFLEWLDALLLENKNNAIANSEEKR